MVPDGTFPIKAAHCTTTVFAVQATKSVLVGKLFHQVISAVLCFYAELQCVLLEIITYQRCEKWGVRDVLRTQGETNDSASNGTYLWRDFCAYKLSGNTLAYSTSIAYYLKSKESSDSHYNLHRTLNFFLKKFWFTYYCSTFQQKPAWYTTFRMSISNPQLSDHSTFCWHCGNLTGLVLANLVRLVLTSWGLLNLAITTG